MNTPYKSSSVPGSQSTGLKRVRSADNLSPVAPRSWALLSGHTPGNRLDRRAKPGEGIRACTCTRGIVVCVGRMDLRVDIVETRLCLDHRRRPPAYSSSSPTPTFRRRSRQTGRVSPLTLAAWNVRSLLDNPRSNRPERRTALVARELARYKVDIAALSETRFSEQGQLEESLRTKMWANERRDPFESVLPKCPMERHVSNFPCPGPHRHYLNFYDDNPNAPVGRGEVLCRLFVFSNLRYSKTNAGGGKYLNGTKRLLESVLICAGTCNVELVLNLGGTIDTSNIETNGELQDLFEDVRSEFEHSFLKVPIGREYTLIVIDGYELLVVDPKKSELCANSSTSSEETGDGFRLNFPVRDSSGRKCSMHEDANSARVGWPQEMQAKGHFLTAGEKTSMPRLRTAVSKSQLRWLEESLLSCMHNNQNVVIAFYDETDLRSIYHTSSSLIY
nr:unnamed protein product [Spirometra erinaceieuropaei]